MGFCCIDNGVRYRGLEDGQLLPDSIKSILSRISDKTICSFRYGRLIIATSLITLFRVDQKWTDENLLPLFDWKDIPEATAVWIGFLKSPHLHLPLMNNLKKQFIETAKHYRDLGDYAELYATFLTFTALDSQGIFTATELKNATSILPLELKLKVIRTLIIALDSAGEQRDDYWKNRILPYYKKIWPRVTNEPDYYEDFAKLCIASHNSFPEAIEKLEYWIRPLKNWHAVIFRLSQSDICKLFPDESLKFISKIIGPDAQPSYILDGLKNCLRLMLDMKPAIIKDKQFIRLLNYASNNS